MTPRLLRLAPTVAAALALSACATVGKDGRTAFPETASKAFYPDKTQTQHLLEQIPPPTRPVAVAVYGFTDQTGQFKPNETGQTLSRAVTQGGASILVKALQDAGNRQWFTIVERESLKNLLNERQIIREMRERYLGEQGVNPQALPALLFAGVLLEGGIVGYDTNTVTGGAGAAFLGIGAKSEYRQDTVTVYLRAVSVRTGEVLTSVTASKTIASQSIGANAFRYVGFKDLLQADIGYTTNEPDQVALQQAVEKAVYALVMEGADLKLWDFADQQAGWPLLVQYKRERDGVVYPATAAQSFNRPSRKSAQADRRAAEARAEPVRPAPRAAVPVERLSAAMAPAVRPRPAPAAVPIRAPSVSAPEQLSAVQPKPAPALRELPPAVAAPARPAAGQQLAVADTSERTVERKVERSVAGETPVRRAPRIVSGPMTVFGN